MVKTFELYTSVTKGQYGTLDDRYIKNHYKASFGALINSKSIYQEVYLSVGANYHHYGEYNFSGEMFDKYALTPLSFDLGVGMRLNELDKQLNKITFGFRFDPLKWETALDFGYHF